MGRGFHCKEDGGVGLTETMSIEKKKSKEVRRLAMGGTGESILGRGNGHQESQCLIFLRRRKEVREVIEGQVMQGHMCQFKD